MCEISNSLVQRFQIWYFLSPISQTFRPHTDDGDVTV